MKDTSRRKFEHLMIALEKDVEGGLTTWFEDVFLIHNATSELSLDDIELEVKFLGYKLKAPIIIAGMTGGHEFTTKINAILAKAAEKLGIGMGVGSQRAAIENPDLAKTYAIVREEAPSAFIIANIGASQIALDYSIEQIQHVIKMVKANALAIHFNLLQEMIQPEGEPNFKGVIAKLKDLHHKINIPIIAKEIGSGISKEVALKLSKAEIDAIDIGGAGGTNWAMIEYHRARKRGDKRRARLSSLLVKWGIPTAVSICEVRSVLPTIPLIATGGIRSGLDIAKAIALGANLAGIGLPLLRAAYSKGLDGVISFINQLIFELKAVMVLVGARTLDDLKRVPIVLSPRFLEWLRMRNITLRRR